MLADASGENDSAQNDAVLATGVLRRLLALRELKFSNSLVAFAEASLAVPARARSRRDSSPGIAFYVDEHNRVPPHAAFRGQTPDEMYFGTGEAIPAALAAPVAAVRRGTPAGLV